VFSSNRAGAYDLYQKLANGGGDEVELLKSTEDKRATSWSGDGRYLLYTTVNPKTNSDIWVLPLGKGKTPIPFLVTKFNERQARFSPDGHWIAYTSDESGQEEVYVRSFSMNSGGAVPEPGARWPISNGFGLDPHWRSDGREIYYRSRGGGLVAVSVEVGRSFQAGSSRPLGPSSFPFGNSQGTLWWDSAPDGKRFLRLATKTGPQPYTVMLNWPATLKK
jgi:Tol biopolymer transport system component